MHGNFLHFRQPEPSSHYSHRARQCNASYRHVLYDRASAPHYIHAQLCISAHIEAKATQTQAKKYPRLARQSLIKCFLFVEFSHWSIKLLHSTRSRIRDAD